MLVKGIITCSDSEARSIRVCYKFIERIFKRLFSLKASESRLDWCKTLKSNLQYLDTLSLDSVSFFAEAYTLFLLSLNPGILILEMISLIILSLGLGILWIVLKRRSTIFVVRTNKRVIQFSSDTKEIKPGNYVIIRFPYYDSIFWKVIRAEGDRLELESGGNRLTGFPKSQVEGVYEGEIDKEDNIENPE